MTSCWCGVVFTVWIDSQM